MNFAAMDKLPAATLQSLSQAAPKTADEPRASNTTLTNDGSMVVPLVANAKYILRHTVVYNANATADLKAKYTVPAGTTMTYTTQVTNIGPAAIGQTEASTVIYDGTGANETIHTNGYIETGANAGNLNWQWAQNISDPGATTIRKASILEITRYQ